MDCMVNNIRKTDEEFFILSKKGSNRITSLKGLIPPYLDSIPYYSFDKLSGKVVFVVDEVCGLNLVIVFNCSSPYLSYVSNRVLDKLVENKYLDKKDEDVYLVRKNINKVPYVKPKIDVNNINDKAKEINDLFSPIIEFKEVKDLFNKSINSNKPVHVLMEGRPGSAKSLFLYEVSRLNNSLTVLGGTTTKSGLIEELIRTKPRYLCIDEIEKMDYDDFTVLLGLCSNGKVKETKFGKHNEVNLPNTRVYAACNNLNKIPEEIKSRFFVIEMPKYSKNEFIDISTNILVMREGVNKKLANYIAKNIYYSGSKDVRDTIKVGRLANNKEDVKWLIKLMRKKKN